MLAKRVLTDGVISFIDFWQSTPIIKTQQLANKDLRLHLRKQRLRHTPEGLAASLRQFGQGIYPNLWEQIIKIKTPTLLITGDQDDKYTKIGKRITSLVNSNSNIVSHERVSSGHAPHFESPQCTAHLIDNYVRENLPDLG